MQVETVRSQHVGDGKLEVRPRAGEQRTNVSGCLDTLPYLFLGFALGRFARAVP